jgi:hypothetical protein
LYRFLEVAIFLAARLFVLADLGAVPTIFLGCFQEAYLLFDISGSAGHFFQLNIPVANHRRCVPSAAGLSIDRS